MRLVRKHDLSCARHFTDAQSHAILAAQSGSSDAAHCDTNLAVLRQAHGTGLWLACDCLKEKGLTPLLTSCHIKDDNKRYWRTLAGHPTHHARCPFARFRTRHHDAATLPPPRTDHVEILYDASPTDRLAISCDQTGHGGERAAQRPPLSRLLLSVIERAGLNRLSSSSNLASPSDWRSLLVQATGTFTLGNGEPLSELWFHRPAAWTSTAVHAQLRQKTPDWPQGHLPQAFLCWITFTVSEERDRAALPGSPPLGRAREGQRRQEWIHVRDGVTLPIIGRTPVPGPYLFIGAVARYTGRPDYECVRAFAQPVVATDCPIPVDSRNERFALGQLRTTVDILSREFPGAQFSITKPLFPMETQIEDQTRYCLPDFLLRITRGATSLLFVIEVMGFDRPSYHQSKAATHPLMATLGTLLKMDATRFHQGPTHRTQQGRRLTQALRAILRQSLP